MESSNSYRLKPPPNHLPPSKIGLRSDIVHPSPIPAQANIRTFYLREVRNGESSLPPPLISHSKFVPRNLVELLMRRKKNSALGVKFWQASSGGAAPDEITNMEGAMHSFVTPVIGSCEMIGDYTFKGGHGVHRFGDVDGGGNGGKVKLTRSVVLSASIQMDFEDDTVMLKVAKLGRSEFLGKDLGDLKILSVQDKQHYAKRQEYDDDLRRCLVFNLTEEKRLPGRKDVHAMDVKETIAYLEKVIMEEKDVVQNLVGKFAELYNDEVVSLELLFHTALHQARNEFSALEALCPQGYVYTYDPASIFAREIGAPILNRLMLAALKHLSSCNKLERIRAFAFNDYADKSILSLVAKALENQKGVLVAKKSELFLGKGGCYDISHCKEAEGAMLVVHNNSDGFGQNIESEGSGGSLDGAIGANSSGAASLERGRNDLLDFVY